MKRILQINVGVGRAAQDLALATASQLAADLLVISEQNHNRQESDGWFADTSSRSAVAALGATPVDRWGPVARGFRWVESSGFRLYSCYWTPNCHIAEFNDFLLRLEISVRTSTLPTIVAGDFNAKSRIWGSDRDDPRGTLLADLMSALDMAVCNAGNAPTFVRGSSESHIDVTFASNRIRGSIHNWRVSDAESLSLHKYIVFEIGTDAAQTQQRNNGWAVGNINRTMLSMALAVAPPISTTGTDANEEAVQLVSWMTQAVSRCTPKRHQGAGRHPAYWWNNEIGGLRKECLKARRLFQRKRNSPNEDLCRELQGRWKGLRKSLAIAIKAAKEKAWAELISIVDKDPWGKPFKIIMKRLRRPKPIPGIELPGRLEAIVDTLFPDGQAPVHTIGSPDMDVDVQAPFTISEITAAARSLPNGKAPGPDGIPNEVIKVATSVDPQRFQSAFNLCISEGKFPKIWKKGRLVLLQKPGKPLDNPSAYRPICLLDGCGKLLEKLIAERLRGHLINEYAIADNQYGFRRGRSTLDALGHLKRIVSTATHGHVYHHRLVGMLTLDVRNAFNSAPWKSIVEAVRTKNAASPLRRVIEAYLSERVIEVANHSGNKRFDKPLSCGVPQGSVLGPDLWNLLYDDLLRLEMPAGVELIAFADDVAVLSTQTMPMLLEESLEEAFTTINEWMTEHGLSLAADKSEALVITKKRVRNKIVVRCAGHAIASKPSLRYLGVQIDMKLGFAEHAELASERAAIAAKQLGFIMPNTGGPRQKSRRLLASVVTSRLLYAAPFWFETMLARGWKKMAAVHRRSQLRVACCYRTVSHGAAAVVSGIPPIHLLAKERTEVYKGSTVEEAKRSLLDVWQKEWDSCPEGRWTHKLIGNIEVWHSRRFGNVTFHMSQILTGHGCFSAYLKRFKIQDSDCCAQCGHSPDNAEHGFFRCDAWENWRRQTCAEIGVDELSPENLVERMLLSPDSWTVISRLMSRIMGTRESEERLRQMQPTPP